MFAIFETFQGFVQSLRARHRKLEFLLAFPFARNGLDIHRLVSESYVAFAIAFDVYERTVMVNQNKLDRRRVYYHPQTLWMPLHFKVKLNNVNEHLVNKKQDQFALFIILRHFRPFVKVKGNNSKANCAHSVVPALYLTLHNAFMQNYKCLRTCKYFWKTALASKSFLVAR